MFADVKFSLTLDVASTPDEKPICRRSYNAFPSLVYRTFFVKAFEGDLRDGAVG